MHLSNIIFPFSFFCIDIAAILMSTENMLWSVCSSVQEFLNPHEDRDLKIYKIHSHCNNMLSVLAILTSPLKDLYEWVWIKHSISDKICSWTYIDMMIRRWVIVLKYKCSEHCWNNFITFDYLLTWSWSHLYDTV